MAFDSNVTSIEKPLHVQGLNNPLMQLSNTLLEVTIELSMLPGGDGFSQALEPEPQPMAGAVSATGVASAAARSSGKL